MADMVAERQRMAQMLGFDRPEPWLDDTLDQLIRIERQEGKEMLYREVRKLLNRSVTRYVQEGGTG